MYLPSVPPVPRVLGRFIRTSPEGTDRAANPGRTAGQHVIILQLEHLSTLVNFHSLHIRHYQDPLFMQLSLLSVRSPSN